MGVENEEVGEGDGDEGMWGGFEGRERFGGNEKEGGGIGDDVWGYWGFGNDGCFEECGKEDKGSGGRKREDDGRDEEEVYR